MLTLKEHVIDAEMTFEQLEFLEHLLEENAPKKLLKLELQQGEPVLLYSKK